jgi:hypothetical protein
MIIPRGFFSCKKPGRGEAGRISVSGPVLIAGGASEAIANAD